MQVAVKLVIFWHCEWDKYCSYCPELHFFFGRGDTIEKCVLVVREELLDELKGRLKYTNLKVRNWQVSENSIIPPTFTDEQAVKLAEENYELSIPEHQIVEINVEVPKPR